MNSFSNKPGLIHVVRSLNTGGIERLLLQYLKVSKEKQWVVYIAEPHDLKDEFLKLSDRVELVFLDRSTLGLYGVMAAFKAMCEEVKPSGVICWFYPFHGLFGLMAKIAGVRRVLVHIGMVQKWNAKKAMLHLLGRLVGCREIAVSRRVMASIPKAYGLSSKSIRLVYNGVDLETFLNKNSVVFRKAPFIIGVVSRLDEHKDFDTLLQAMRLVCEKYNVLLRVAGTGSRRKELESKGNDYSVPIEWCGLLMDIPLFLNEIDIFVFPATPLEGLGVALIEAMACELPVLAPRDTVCEEIIEDHVSGLLFNYGDAGDLSRKILNCIEDKEMRKELSIGARARCEKQFSFHSMKNQYESLLGIGK